MTDAKTARAVAAAAEVFLRPQHEYTKALFAAAPGRNFAFSTGNA